MSNSALALPENSILLAGPTASGKSELALWLARKLGGEIITVDSMQVYRGLDIGTAKPSAREQAEVPHHLVDVVDLSAGFDVARFLTLARQALAQVVARGAVPIFCGGTGLYFTAMLEGLGKSPPRDPALRETLEQTPLPELLEELARLDPQTYASIDRQNPRRVVRAMEIIRLTGKPASTQRATWSADFGSGKPSCLGLRRTNEDLRDRIDKRVDWMFENGLVEETRSLLDHGLADNPTAMQAIGYRQVVEFLQDVRSLEETVQLVKTRTWQFARRQMTWFRGKLPMTWVEVDPGAEVNQVGQRILD